jgi:hypothetical protein
MNLSLITRRKGSEVLLAESGREAALPAHDDGMPTPIREDIEKRYGLATVYLGPLAQLSEDVRVHALAARDADDKDGGGGHWVNAERLAGLSFAAGQPAGLVADRLAGSAALAGVPWTEPGWFDRAAGWARAELLARGTPATGPVEQFIVSPWACTLRIPVGGTYAYFKAAPPVFRFEPDLNRLLHNRFPDHTIPLVATHPSEAWMLSMDLGEATVIEVDLTAEHLPVYLRALRSYAAMQHALVADVDQLLAMGIPDRRPAALPDLYDEIVADTAGLGLGHDWGIDEPTHRALLAYAPRFRRECAELAAAGLPDTLFNTDWWHGNISFRDGGDVMFDWAESVVGNPLCSLTTVTRIAETGGMPEFFVNALVDAYLAEWGDVAEPGELRRLYELARAGAYLSRAQSWRACVRLHADPYRYERDRGAVANNMRRLLPLLG